jgi:hypothetical protein
MSQYRDDHDAARRRVDALEAKLAERDAEVHARDEALVARDAEIAKLQRELDLSRALGFRAQPLRAAWFTRVAIGALGLLFVTAAAALSVLWATPPAPRAAPAPAETVAAVPQLLADPGPMGVDRGPSPADPTQADAPAMPEPSEEAVVRRRLEPRVWGGTATQDEIRMLGAICGHMGDRACHDRAKMLLLSPR